MNVLWIMADQLRWDYLSCAGAKHIDTPNLDWLASRGLRFDRAYVQSPICGPSRMSFYTGRYVRSHGATWNGFPLRVGEVTLGDHLRELGVTCSLVGKTHMTPDVDGMQRLGIEPDSTIGALVSECGFDVFVRDDGTKTHHCLPEYRVSTLKPRGSQHAALSICRPENLTTHRGFATSVISNLTGRIWHQRLTTICTVQPTCHRSIVPMPNARLTTR